MELIIFPKTNIQSGATEKGEQNYREISQKYFNENLHDIPHFVNINYLNFFFYSKRHAEIASLGNCHVFSFIFHETFLSFFLYT